MESLQKLQLLHRVHLVLTYIEKTTNRSVVGYPYVKLYEDYSGGIYLDDYDNNFKTIIRWNSIKEGLSYLKRYMILHKIEEFFNVEA